MCKAAHKVVLLTLFIVALVSAVLATEAKPRSEKQVIEATESSAAVIQIARHETVVSSPAPARWQIYERLVVPSPGHAYRDAAIRDHSHYLTPVETRSGRLAGRSRRWGDATRSVQLEAIKAIVSECRRQGFTEGEICFALALVRVESGFNPDAAAGTSSAAGLCQFIDKTREELCRRAGIRHGDPFDVRLNAVCLCEALREAFAFAKRKTGDSNSTRYYCMAYAYHHDGPSLAYGGYELAQERVIPWMEIARECVAVVH